MTMATITLKNVKKRFGKVEVIQGINAEITNGEFIVIVGPSGCGKSTLLRLVAGLETLSEGEIEIDGTVVNKQEPTERNIAMVFQNYALYPHMTVEQNMGYGLKIAKVPKSEIARKIRETAQLLQLENLLDRKPRQLSGGQRQRVAMGRAIVREPSVFLFDEPLSNLDAKLRAQMRLEIKELQQSLGITALYVTHDQTEAMTMADRMIIMNKGNVEQIGTPLEAYQTPQTVFSAQFVGNPAMNMLNAKIDGDFVCIGSEKICSKPSGFGGVDILVGIRPEHIEVGGSIGIEMQIKMTELLGTNTIVHGTVVGLDLPITVNLVGLHTISKSEKSLRLNFPEESCHLFDPDSEKRLQN